MKFYTTKLKNIEEQSILQFKNIILEYQKIDIIIFLSQGTQHQFEKYIWVK